MSTDYKIVVGSPRMRGSRDYYTARKITLQDEAIAFCESFAEGRAWSYGELADRQAYFEQQGRRYGLLREFRENSIC